MGLADEGLLTADQIAGRIVGKLNGHKRGAVSIGGSQLAKFVDVQGKLLY